LVDRRVAAQLANTNRFGVQKELSTNTELFLRLSFQKRGNDYETLVKSISYMFHAFESGYAGSKPLAIRSLSTPTLNHPQSSPTVGLSHRGISSPYKLPDRAWDWKQKHIMLFLGMVGD
jgi:hypothetical protein